MQEKKGDRIKALRAKRGLTLEQLASTAGSSKGYIWDLENTDASRLSANKLVDIARALGVTSDYLMGCDDQTLDKAEDIAFFRRYSELSDDIRAIIREIAESLAKVVDKELA